ncbi:MAG TPA: glutathione S-transferase family protein [Solirubrobacteraceae bacterium]|nr:glutathione S-transferase family protein [Solirubrobacteraceae bacterium]
MAGTVKLYGFTGSNAVYTGRLMLEHKGIEYDFVELPPAAHAFILLALGFETTGAPALKVGDRRVQGTRWIARTLDELCPDKPLFPADPEARYAVELAERWGEELQNAARRIFYCASRRDRSAFMSVLGAGRGATGRAALRVMAPVIMKLATGAHRATDDAGREDVARLPERLDQIDAWIAEGVIGGAELNAADFQIAVNVSALLLSEDLAPFIEGRPAAALARRVAPGYEGRIRSVLPEDWLASLHGRPGEGGPPSGADELARPATRNDDRIATVVHDPTR